MNLEIKLLIVLLTGLGTIIGGFIVFFTKKKNNSLIAITTGFAVGIMSSISIFELIPSGFLTFKKLYIIDFALFLGILYLSLGFAIAHFFNHIIPKYTNENSKLFRIGIFSMLALLIHNIPEGIIIFISLENNITLGIFLIISILLHNIPEGIVISLPIYYSTKSRFKALFFTFISGLGELIGVLIVFFIFKNFITDNVISILLLITAGIMLYISYFELIKNSFYYNKRLGKKSIIIGIIFILFLKLIFNLFN